MWLRSFILFYILLFFFSAFFFWCNFFHQLRKFVDSHVALERWREISTVIVIFFFIFYFILNVFYYCIKIAKRKWIKLNYRENFLYIVWNFTYYFRDLFLFDLYNLLIIYFIYLLIIAYTHLNAVGLLNSKHLTIFLCCSDCHHDLFIIIYLCEFRIFHKIHRFNCFLLKWPLTLV